MAGETQAFAAAAATPMTLFEESARDLRGDASVGDAVRVRRGGDGGGRAVGALAFARAGVRGRW